MRQQQQQQRYYLNNTKYYPRMLLFIKTSSLLRLFFLLMTLSSVSIIPSKTNTFVEAYPVKSSSSSSYETSSSSTTQQQTQTQTEGSGPKGIITLTTRNFNSNIRDGNVWLIEFYAPWCGHCTHFMPIYKEIADYYHIHKRDSGVRIGKIDATSERAIAQRFNVHSYPTFFLIDGYSVYEYDMVRNKKNIHDFIQYYNERHEAIPFFNSPMGPVGLFLGLLVSIGMFISDIFIYLQESFHLSPMVTALVLGFVAIFGGLFSMILLVIITTPKMKDH